MTRPDVVVVGGGVIGLSIAYQLAREGVRAALLDRGDLGRPASWAGAGIISPGGDRRPATALGMLRARSARLFPAWSAALLGETGIDNGYRRSGGLDVALDDEDDRALRASAGRWRDEGIAWERLAPADVPKVEPALTAEFRSAYFLPDRAQIRNPRHIKALRSALAGRGVEVRTDLAARGFRESDGRVLAVTTDEGDLACGRVVVAAGPWTEGLLVGLGVRIATPPIRGQIVLLKTGGDGPSRIVEHGRNYLVPRDDGRVLAGATEEEAGFDLRTTSAAVRDLIDAAVRLCPGLAGAEVEAAWAGLRPGSLDARPTIGFAPGLANLLVATGHRRAGLQQSPATAELATDLLLDRAPAIDPDEFRPGREPIGEADPAFRS